jgi:hypothetical protein
MRLAPLILAAAVPVDVHAQLIVAPRRAGQSRVRHSVFEWQHVDLATGSIGAKDASRGRIDDRCPDATVDPPGIRLYFYEAERAIAQRAAPRIESVYRELACRFGHLPEDRLPYVLYSSYREFLTTNLFPVQEGVLGVTSTEDLKLTLPYFGDARLFEEVSSHEMAHQFTIDKVRAVAAEAEASTNPLQELPLWFVEGLAEHYAHRGIDQEAEMLARDLATNPDADFGYVMLDFFDDRPFSGLWTYKLGQMRCGFLEETYGEGTIQEILDATPRLTGGKKDRKEPLPDFASLVAEVTGDSAVEITQGFATWIKTRAFRAYLAADQGLGALEPLPIEDDLHALAMAASDGGHLIAIRTFRPETSQTELLLLDDRAPGNSVSVAIDGVPGIESLHPTSGRDFDLDDERIVYVAEHNGADVIHVQAIRDVADEIELPGQKPFWRVDLSTGSDETFELEDHGILAVFSVAIAPGGKRIAFIGLDVAGQRDLYVLDLETREIIALTDDVFAERSVAWGPAGIVFNSDATSHHRFNLFRVASVETASIARLTTEPSDHLMPAVLPSGRTLFTAYEQGGANLYEVKDGYTVRLTDVATGLFEPSPGKDGGVWAMLHHGGRRRPVHLEVDDLLEVEKRSIGSGLMPARTSTRSLDGSIAYDPLSISNWELGGIFGLFGAGAGGIFGLLFASATDFLRDHVLVLNLQVTGRIDLIDGQLFYFNQAGRLNWGGGIFQELRFRSIRTDRDRFPFLERYFGGEAIVRYPLSRFWFLQASLSAGGTQSVDSTFVGLAPVDRPLDFQAELSGRFGFDTVRYHPSTGPIKGSSAIVDATLTTRPGSGDVEALFRLDGEYFFPVIGTSNIMLRGSAGASVGGEDAREFLLWSWYTLRGVDLGNTDVLLGRYYWFLTAELQVPLDFILRTAIFGVEGVVGLDFGGVAVRPEDLWDRRVLDVAAGFNLLFGPLVLRIHFAWPLPIGPPRPAENVPVTNVSLGWLYF